MTKENNNTEIYSDYSTESNTFHENKYIEKALYQYIDDWASEEGLDTHNPDYIIWREDATKHAIIKMEDSVDNALSGLIIPPELIAP